MVRGLYIAGTGMMLQRRRMETITNNIANADTTGFRRENLVSHSFDEVMINRINDAPAPGFTRNVGPMHLGTQIEQIYIDFSSGNLEGTQRSTDLALAGDVFFVMGTPAGEMYSRAGAFYIDSAGYLIDGAGNFLLGENGPIYVGGPNFSVDELGGVRVGGEFVDTILVASFEDNATLRKVGDNLFLSEAAPMGAANEYRIFQGYIESSNVDISREMVDMLTVFRTYETNQRMVTMIDETVGRAVNDIARLR